MTLHVPACESLTSSHLHVLDLQFLSPGSVGLRTCSTATKQVWRKQLAGYQVVQRFWKPRHTLAQGWELARDHAMTAVGTDNQMRIWYSDSAALEGGLLFKCALGSVDLESPVGAPSRASVCGRAPWAHDHGGHAHSTTLGQPWPVLRAGLLQKRGADNGGADETMEATLTGQLGTTQRDLARRLQRQAALAWWRAGHPGWAIWPVDTEDFMRNAQARPRAAVCLCAARRALGRSHGLTGRAGPGTWRVLCCGRLLCLAAPVPQTVGRTVSSTTCTVVEHPGMRTRVSCFSAHIKRHGTRFH